MKIDRTKNAVRNIAFGSLSRMMNIVLPFISRTVILYVLGTEYLGLSSLFSSILSFLSLTELGVGSALTYSMYEPIAKEDKSAICALMNLYRKLYFFIGSLILLFGLALMPFLRKLIQGEVPADINIYLLYLLYLLNAVLSYWLFAYKNALLQAHQRNDINSKISMIIIPISYVVMLGALAITKNYYWYILWMPVFTILTNILRAIYVEKLFPGLVPAGQISQKQKESITKKVAALFGTKLNTVVLHAADNIVMSAFLGLNVIAVYGNYYYIMSSITGFLGICYSSMTAGLGNSLVLEPEEKNYSDFLKFSFMNSWLVGWCTVCLVCLYQPFMFLWVHEELMFPFSIALQFALYFFIYQIRKIPITYKDAAGIWWEDRFRPYVCMVVNLILNIILVQIIGVSGIILSTVFSLLISIPWENYTIFKYVFHRNSKEYYGKMAVYFLSMAAGGLMTYLLCSLLPDGFLPLLIRAAICLVVPNLVFYFLNREREECRASVSMIKHILNRG